MKCVEDDGNFERVEDEFSSKEPFSQEMEHAPKTAHSQCCRNPLDLSYPFLLSVIPRKGVQLELWNAEAGG